MKSNTFLATALAVSAASAHTIMQKISVNGVDQGQLYGVRAPSSNYPIQDVTDASFACNKAIMYQDSNVISVPAGAKVGGWWGHVIGGPQVPNDPENPIATSHHGPIINYLAKVGNAATTGTTGLQWFKVAEDGLSGGQWAVDRMVAAAGWHYFTLPTCIAPGDYLLRSEIIALHNAGSVGGAQFYIECAQIRVTSSGTTTGSNIVSFPGAYQSNDPGILINIYDSTGQPFLGGKAYPIPGPPVVTCGAGSAPASTSKSAATTTAKMTTSVVTPPKTSTSAAPASTSKAATGGAALYAQCGGQGWTGATTCASGTCKVSNQYYSQCLP